MLTTMRETKELGFFMCPDRIHHMVAFVVQDALNTTERTEDSYVCCLACNDRTIRLVTKSALVEELGCEAPVTSLALHTEAADSSRYLFYGTQVGSIGVFRIHENNTLRRSGNYVPPQNRQAAVTSMCVHDVDLDGAGELLVGYEDGTVQVFRLSRGDTGYTFEVMWSTEVGEQVMTILGGMVTKGPSDVVVHLFSGSVLCFTLQREVPKPVEAVKTGPSQLQLLGMKKADLEADLKQLKNRINSTVKDLAIASGAMEKKAPVVAVASLFKATVTLRPLDNKPLLSLSINADVPLEYCIVHSLIETRFIGTETSSVYHSELPPQNRKAKSMALVCPTQDGAVAEGRKRIEIQLWADEGQAGEISVVLYALPKPRTAQLKTILLTALPLYSRVASVHHLMTPEEAPFVLSQISFSGAFSKPVVHMWLTRLLPGMENLHQVNPTMFFASDYLLSVLIVEMQVDEEAEQTTVSFTSDSVVALNAVKDVVTLLAAERKTELRTKENILFGSVDRRLRKLEPVMAHASTAAERMLLLEGLRELQSDDTDLGYLPPHLSELLTSSDAVAHEAETHQEHIKYIQRAVVNLYKSAVNLLRHAPALNADIRKRLEQASTGSQFSFQQLEALFFPKKENASERVRLGGAEAEVNPHSQDLVRRQESEIQNISGDLHLSDSRLVSSPSDGEL
ncbi:FG-GAPprotein [Angomonas deanei]|uniref:Uncharacterized protein n=1 Tax=Angomonas deanei TaxID=59799 RepID=A0A7G2C2E0_9TRYP|nr:FG-GAPprotein [Angomonas deanei]CAD2213371.1 hypothetical protein, conserved [Angomonas deanei]|eukprot:EPY29792.1 FG-GAPprotein [Angomonas deanei]